MEYYLAFKRKEILSHATTWMNFEDIMLSEISQPQKDKYHLILFIWDTRIAKLIETENINRTMVAKGWGQWGNGELVLNGDRV